jgi:hypothetical protein
VVSGDAKCAVTSMLRFSYCSFMLDSFSMISCSSLSSVSATNLQNSEKFSESMYLVITVLI